MVTPAMSDDRPNPLTDVRKGLGLLFRAARTAVGRLPKGDLEEAVVASAREVGRAIENVATTLEREVLGKRNRGPGPEAKGQDAPPKSDEPKTPSDRGAGPPRTD
jgi:hypothetical protein